MNANKNIVLLVKSYLECNKNVVDYDLYDLLDGNWTLSVRISENTTIGNAKSLRKEFNAILKQLGVNYASYPEDNDIDSWCFDIQDLYL